MFINVYKDTHQVSSLMKEKFLQCNTDDLYLIVFTVKQAAASQYSVTTYFIFPLW